MVILDWTCPLSTLYFPLHQPWHDIPRLWHPPPPTPTHTEHRSSLPCAQVIGPVCVIQDLCISCFLMCMCLCVCVCVCVCAHGQARRRWGDKTLYLKIVKCSGEPKNMAAFNNTIMNGTAFFSSCHSGSIFTD